MDRFGWSLLHHAANHAFPKIVDFLLVRGAEVNRKSIAGLTPLMVALNSLSQYNQRDVYQAMDSMILRPGMPGFLDERE